MPDYGHELAFGSFLTPSNERPDTVVALAWLSEQVGLDLATFQDHPYQPAFLDTWTLLSYLAARTERIHLAANVLNLPLRQPAVLARSAASLDLLSGGRFELGLGAGAFWDAIEAMGGPRRSPGAAVEALGEAIDVIHGIWDVGDRTRLRVDGRHYRVDGAKRGPAPAHPVGIWLGAYKPRMLRLTGAKADGWLPSLGYLRTDQLAGANRAIDEAAEAAGREPGAVRRMLNLTGTFDRTGEGFLAGPPEQWAEQLSALALDEGISTFILGGDDPEALEIFGQQVAPTVRERVASGRAGQVAPSASMTPPASVASSASRASTEDEPGQYDRLDLAPTPDDGDRLSERRIWTESDRPHRTESSPDVTYNPRGRQVGQHLIDVHDMLRRELEQLRDIVTQVRDGRRNAASAREEINQLTLRQNDWVLGAYCANYCQVVASHHSLEDTAVFPHLRRQDGELEPVLDRLAEEHVAIHHLLGEVDAALVRHIEDPSGFTAVQDAVDLLTDALLSHLSYEEYELVEPLARLGFYPQQV